MDQGCELIISHLLQDLDPETGQVEIDEVLEYCKITNCPLLETSAKVLKTQCPCPHVSAAI